MESLIVTWLLDSLTLSPVDAVIVGGLIVAFLRLDRRIVNAPRTERAQNGIAVKLQKLADGQSTICSRIDSLDTAIDRIDKELSEHRRHETDIVKGLAEASSALEILKAKVL